MLFGRNLYTMDELEKMLFDGIIRHALYFGKSIQYPSGYMFGVITNEGNEEFITVI